MTEISLGLLWGVKSIARAAGTTERMVHEMRRLPGCPIRQLRAGGKVYVQKDALALWLVAINKTDQNVSNG